MSKLLRFSFTSVFLCFSLVGCANGDPAVSVSKQACEASAGQKSFSSLPTYCLEKGVDYRATIVTDKGTLVFDLFENTAPLATGNMRFLSKAGYYNDTVCHRAIRGFVLQCGDPTGSGAGGPGYVFADELTGSEKYQAGTLAMANSGPNTNGSQFFIVTGDGASNLPPNYTIFGLLQPGQESLLAAIDELGNPDPAANGVPPLGLVTIKSVLVAPGE